MKLSTVINLVVAAVILVAHKQMLDLTERKYKINGWPFDRKKAFFVMMAAVVICIVRAFL